ncbi:MAG: S-layer homology domain-containing protein [Marinisporobacter sp.]|jgi:hypothetical protein|nr:S-layer homology domain-containing protein [Marinisporobacter sp.]
MNIKRIITLLLVLAMMIAPFNSFALEKPNVNITGGEVMITGHTDADADVKIVIENENKRYFIDNIVADGNGKYIFNTVLPKNMIFSGKITGKNETIDFKIDTKKEIEDPSSHIEKQYVTLSIDLFTIDKGYLISPTKVELKDDDTVWSVLKRELENRNISYKHRFNSNYNSVYVVSIDEEGEFDHGSGSGWMYEVNGDYPGIGASQYRLKGGDVIKWRYTTDLGKDLGAGFDDKPVGVIKEDTIEIKKGDNPVVNIPNEKDKNYVVKFDKSHQNVKKVTIHIPDCESTVTLDFSEIKEQLPNMHVDYNKEEASLYIPKETVIKSGIGKIEVFGKVDQTSEKLKEQISTILQEGETLTKINKAFKMGNSKSVIFDRAVMLRFKDCKDKHAAFIEKNQVNAIKIYANEAEGKAYNESEAKYEYAYYDGNDLIIKTNHFTDYIVYTKESEKQLYEELSYVDKDEISGWALEAIKEATALKLVNGDEKNRFNPKAGITRAEFTTIITKMLQLDTKVDKAINFKDVKENDWFYPYVNAAYKEKIVSGLGYEFKPNDPITREQMAVIITQALKLNKAKINYEIKDMNEVSEWAKVEVSTVFDNKIIVGYNNQFNPKDKATREMAVVVCINALKLKDHVSKN